MNNKVFFFVTVESFTLPVNIQFWHEDKASTRLIQVCGNQFSIDVKVVGVELKILWGV